jgi:hypothetical protein
MKLPQGVHTEIDKLAADMDYGEITINVNKELKDVQICSKKHIRVNIDESPGKNIVQNQHRND